MKYVIEEKPGATTIREDGKLLCRVFGGKRQRAQRASDIVAALEYAYDDAAIDAAMAEGEAKP